MTLPLFKPANIQTHIYNRNSKQILDPLPR